jgi:hypothetical protein
MTSIARGATFLLTPAQHRLGQAGPPAQPGRPSAASRAARPSDRDRRAEAPRGCARPADSAGLIRFMRFE